MSTKTKLLLSAALLSLSAPALAAINAYNDDFEGLDIADSAALSNQGWVVFGNVFNPDGSYDRGYGPFPAPNGGDGFSAIATGEGGPGQGLQQLSIYSDYNNTGDQGAGQLVEANTFIEQTIEASDVGSTWTLSFDAKAGNIVSPSTGYAFLKTIDPGSGFATTNFVQFDTTAIGANWSGGSLSLTIDAGLVGQLFQFGFSATATNFVSSGIFYDNVDFSSGAGGDSDGDGVDDSTDNCTDVPNASQLDTNGDMIGNACDGDLNNDCNTNLFDLVQFKNIFGATGGPNDADFNGDNNVNLFDLVSFKNLFGSAPGPSAAGCN